MEAFYMRVYADLVAKQLRPGGIGGIFMEKVEDDGGNISLTMRWHVNHEKCKLSEMKDTTKL
jgi:hypothetical protein